MRLCTLFIVTAVGLSVGCRPQATPSADARIAAGQAELAALDAKRQKRVRDLKGMSVSRLAAELVADSTRGVEPFNSMAYREIATRGAAAATQLSATLTPAPSSFLTLLAIRQLDPAKYRTVEPRMRDTILVGALRESKSFNAWGIPHLFWEDAGKAIIEAGRSIENPLAALLDDKREARVWGSEGAQEAQRYRYRVCDYAWALLNEIRGTRVMIPNDPLERDRLIAATRRG